MAYVIEGNLYLQDGYNPPVQLTDDERLDKNPVFADDGEKIVFLRGMIPHDLYSINPDGSQEQLLVSGSELSKLGLGYDELLSEILFYKFIPGTHQLIFSTHQLDESDLNLSFRENLWGIFNADLLLVDADTAEIRSVLAPGKGGGFVAAPTGNMIAVSRQEQIDLLDLTGQIIHRNLISFTPTQPVPLGPHIFWNKDATELLVTLPIDAEYAFDGPESRVVWRIPIDGSAKTLTSLEPPVLASDYSISPDGNWILYNYYFYPGKTDDSVISGLYLGNLLEGGIQLVAKGSVQSLWSPDSNHFIYGTHVEWFLGTTDGQSDQIAIRGISLGWLNSDYFLFFDKYDAEIVTIGGIDGTVIDIPVPPSLFIYPNTFAFVYLKYDL